MQSYPIQRKRRAPALSTPPSHKRLCRSPERELPNEVIVIVDDSDEDAGELVGDTRPTVKREGAPNSDATNALMWHILDIVESIAEKISPCKGGGNSKVERRSEERAIDEIIETNIDFIKQWFEEGLMDTTPTMEGIVIEWASRFKMTSGAHEGRRLDDISMYYINRFLLQDGGAWPEDSALFVALRAHLLVRKPEVPGSKHRLGFGKYKGCTLQEAYRRSNQENKLEQEYLKAHPMWSPRKEKMNYLEWLSSDSGMPEKMSSEELAEGLEYIYRQQLAEYEREHPGAAAYTFPQNQAPFKQGHPMEHLQSQPIATIPEYDIEWLKQMLEHPSAHAYGVEFKGMDDAMIWYKKVQRTCRWNWRRLPRFGDHSYETLPTAGAKNYTSSHPRLLKMLYPSNKIPVPDWDQNDVQKCTRGYCGNSWRCYRNKIVRWCDCKNEAIKDGDWDGVRRGYEVDGYPDFWF